MSQAQPIVLVYTTDLFFSVRIQDVVERYGGRMQPAQTAQDLAQGMGQVPVLAIVELDAGGQGAWISAVQHARKWTRGIPIVAFGSHLDKAARQAARQAQCDVVWSRSRFVEELPALIERYLTPVSETPGCEQSPNELVRRGLALFNQGAYYKCHDALEEAWVQERRSCRDLYQGILQLAIALHHIENLNYRGADKMFRRAIQKFQRLPQWCQGIDVSALHARSRELLHILEELGSDGIAVFPRHHFPTILITEPVDPAP